MPHPTDVVTRRALMLSGVTAAAATLVACTSRTLVGNVERVPAVPAVVRREPVPAPAAKAPPPVAPALLGAALAALDRNGRMIRYRDRIGIVDFAAPSSQPRFHVVDVASGEVTKFLVAHGAGSDPAHTGFLHRFSNQEGSNASSEGAFVLADYYVGKHGRSQRLLGLDPTNSNALERAIVVHGAWYANPDMLPSHGKLGRSQGCFAVGEQDLSEVFGRLGQGRMIYSARV